METKFFSKNIIKGILKMKYYLIIIKESQKFLLRYCLSFLRFQAISPQNAFMQKFSLELYNL